MVNMAKRDIVKGFYVVRDKKGRFKRWSSKGRSLSHDRRKKVSSKRIPKTKKGKLRSGYGHRGDYRRKSGLSKAELREWRSLKYKSKKYKIPIKRVSLKNSNVSFGKGIYRQLGTGTATTIMNAKIKLKKRRSK